MLPQSVLLALVAHASAFKLQLNSPADLKDYHLNKRDLQASGFTKAPFWTVDASVGSTAQTLSLKVMFSAGDTYLVESDNVACVDPDENDEPYEFDCSTTTFNISKSDTFSYNITDWGNGAYEYEYLYGFAFDEVIREAYYGSDDLTVGDYTFSNFKLGVANDTMLASSLGLGARTAEDTAWQVDPYMYPNFIGTLKDNGTISKELLSIYFPDQDSYDGEILFGEVDYAKMENELTLLPYQKRGFNDSSIQLIQEPIISANSLGYKVNSQKGTFDTFPNVPFVLDFESPYTVLPQNFLLLYSATFGFEFSYDSGYDLLYFKCDTMDVDEAFNRDAFIVNFQGQVIEFPIANQILFEENGYCFVSLKSGGSSSYASLGITFLKSMYVVLDYEDEQIGIAQAKFTDDSNVVAVNDTVSARSAADYTEIFHYNTDEYTTQTDDDVFTVATDLPDMDDLGITQDEDDTFTPIQITILMSGSSASFSDDDAIDFSESTITDDFDDFTELPESTESSDIRSDIEATESLKQTSKATDEASTGDSSTPGTTTNTASSSGSSVSGGGGSFLQAAGSFSALFISLLILLF